MKFSRDYHTIAGFKANSEIIGNFGIFEKFLGDRGIKKMPTNQISSHKTILEPRNRQNWNRIFNMGITSSKMFFFSKTFFNQLENLWGLNKTDFTDHDRKQENNWFRWCEEFQIWPKISIPKIFSRNGLHPFHQSFLLTIPVWNQIIEVTT